MLDWSLKQLGMCAPAIFYAVIRLVWCRHLGCSVWAFGWRWGAGVSDCCSSHEASPAWRVHVLERGSPMTRKAPMTGKEASPEGSVGASACDGRTRRCRCTPWNLHPGTQDPCSRFVSARLSRILESTSLSMDILLADYPGVKDSWLDIIGSHDESLLALDISNSTITNEGLACLEPCTKLQSLSLNYCDHIADEGLSVLTGCCRIVPQGLGAYSSLG